MSRRGKVLLLDLFASRSRPYVPAYLYLGAFLDDAGVPNEVYRWRGDEAELRQIVAGGGFCHVFVNLIVGDVLRLVEPVLSAVRQADPGVEVWVGGLAVRFLRSLLAECPLIDRLCDGDPRRDPAGFAAELIRAGLLDRVPASGRFPCLSANRRLAAYVHQHERGGELIGAVNLNTAVGCPARCRFCYLAPVRPWAQPVDDLIADLSALAQAHGVCYFEFSDDNFPADRERLRELHRKVRQARLDFSYFCLGSIDALDEAVLDEMLEGGLKRLFIGVDAINPDALRRLGKNYGPDRVQKILALVRQRPIDLTLALVLGTPGETASQIEELFAWAASIEPEICELSFLTPYPGTPTFRQAVALGMRPPTTLTGWADLAGLETPKPFFNPAVGPEQYLAWRDRFKALSTYRFRSGIGDSARRLNDVRPTYPRF